MCFLKKVMMLGVNKSPRPDNIAATILKNCASHLSKPLTGLMKHFFNTGVLPHDWKATVVRSIYKKEDKFDVFNL